MLILFTVKIMPVTSNPFWIGFISTRSSTHWAEAENFGWPFIVRLAGLHGGKSMIRVSGVEDYSALHVFPFDGRDFYLTQYVDCRDSEGFHQRQRLIVVDGKAVLRGALYDENWKVHGASRSFMLTRENWEADRERSRMFESEVIPRLDPAIAEITRRLKLELYGIDCKLDADGTMLVFEANANMNMLTNDHPEMNDRMSMIKDHILAKLKLTNIRYAGRQSRLQYYIGFSQQYTDKHLVEQFNATLLDLYRQGVAQAILKTYNMEPVEVQ
jgi:hypothetical protein